MVCSGGAGALRKISQEDVIRYVERHAQDWGPETGKAMCWSLRAFLRYLHHRGLNARSLADCVPSMRRWKLATLPTYLRAAQVRRALDGCDRETVMGRRDYAILLLLAKLGLRADEVATLTVDDIDWRASEILVRAKGRQRARMPIPPDIGAAIVAYLRNGRPKSSCRRLFVRTLAPHVGFAFGCAITMIAKAALDRVGIEGCAHRGAHIFRHSLATDDLAPKFYPVLSSPRLLDLPGWAVVATGAGAEPSAFLQIAGDRAGRARNSVQHFARPRRAGHQRALHRRIGRAAVSGATRGARIHLAPGVRIARAQTYSGCETSEKGEGRIMSRNTPRTTGKPQALRAYGKPDVLRTSAKSHGIRIADSVLALVATFRQLLKVMQRVRYTRED
ncbi:tyrosine-type recombinase/integrase [Bradyrhizobium elkanii]|uniref:tyrosine-type recombinase/integrase n=1 Tax=Bradyrhizobium elkanii TaxID=29448 RepID=UPI003F73A140